LIRNYDLGEIFDYINPRISTRRHLGFQNYVEAFEGRRPPRRAEAARDRVEESRGNRFSRASDISAKRRLQIFSPRSPTAIAPS